MFSFIFHALKQISRADSNTLQNTAESTQTSQMIQ